MRYYISSIPVNKNAYESAETLHALGFKVTATKPGCTPVFTITSPSGECCEAYIGTNYLYMFTLGVLAGYKAVKYQTQLP